MKVERDLSLQAGLVRALPRSGRMSCLGLEAVPHLKEQRDCSHIDSWKSTSWRCTMKQTLGCSTPSTKHQALMLRPIRVYRDARE
eukprot:scaffold5855_cov90-Skeletonema_dohrnii-CCMP3373.AAC.1